MSYVGDFAPGDTIDLKFCTVTTTGAPTALAGTPAISVYKDNSATQSTSGVTLSADFDTVTGLNNVRITTGSDASFYSSGSNFQVVITTGTVGGTSVVGYVVGQFSLGRKKLAPQQGRAFVFQKAATSKTIYLHARDAATGAPKTGLVYNTSGLVASYALNQSARAAITLATLASASAVWSSGGFVLVDDTNMPGLYRLDVPNAALASTDQCEVYLNLAGVEFTLAHIDLVDYDPIAAPDSTATLVDAFWDEADAEESAVPAANASFRDKLNYVFMKFRNKGTLNKSTGAYILYADDGSTTVASRTDTDNGTTYTKAEDA